MATPAFAPPGDHAATVHNSKFPNHVVGKSGEIFSHHQQVDCCTYLFIACALFDYVPNNWGQVLCFSCMAFMILLCVVSFESQAKLHILWCMPSSEVWNAVKELLMRVMMIDEAGLSYIFIRVPMAECVFGSQSAELYAADDGREESSGRKAW